MPAIPHQRADYDIAFFPSMWLADFGFKIANTGGNLQVWRLAIDARSYVDVSTNDGEAFGNPDATDWIWVRYLHDRPDFAGAMGSLECVVTHAYAHVLAWGARCGRE